MLAQLTCCKHVTGGGLALECGASLGKRREGVVPLLSSLDLALARLRIRARRRAPIAEGELPSRQRVNRCSSVSGVPSFSHFLMSASSICTYQREASSDIAASSCALFVRFHGLGLPAPHAKRTENASSAGSLQVSGVRSEEMADRLRGWVHQLRGARGSFAVGQEKWRSLDRN